MYRFRVRPRAPARDHERAAVDAGRAEQDPALRVEHLRGEVAPEEQGAVAPQARDALLAEDGRDVVGPRLQRRVQAASSPDLKFA